MMMNHLFHRPEPVLSSEAQPVDRCISPLRAAEQLRDGEVLLVTDHYSTGAEILEQLQRVLRPPSEGASFSDRQNARRLHRAAALRLLAPIVEHRVELTDGKPIGFLQELYPELPSFSLPFVQVQELFGAWNRYQEGVHLAVLGHSVHPFYGTYVPTRVSHLELFGTWLSQYQGSRTHAVDVGTGCGVLAFMLCRAGFERVLGTDNNVNAVESVSRDVKRLSASSQIDLFHGDLLGEDTEPTDLIVFNPPWIQGEVESLLDGALYFETGLFERFFDQAVVRLKPTGRLVLLFSTVIQLVQPEHPHPIVAELERGRFALVQKLHRKVKPGRTQTGQRRRTKERVEVWELKRL